MKKKVLFLFPLLSLLFTAGCSSTPTVSKVSLTYSTLVDTSFTSLTYEEYADKMALANSQHVESFIILVYNDCGCGTTNVVKSIVNSIVADSHIVIYGIDAETERLYDYYNKTGLPERNHGLTYRSSYPSISIVENGVVKATKEYDQTLYENKGAKIKEWISSSTIASKIYKVNDDYLSTHEIKEAVIYFGRYGCSDCQYVEPNVLFPYMKKTISETLFLAFDIQDYWAKDYGEAATEEQKEAYENYCAFKDKYHLSVNGSEEFGYQSGVVPTFQYIKDNEVVDMCVYGNDTVSKSGEKILITNSYYDGRNNPFLSHLKEGTVKELIGIDVTADAVKISEDSYYLPVASEAAYHTPILEGFLDYYLI